MKSHNRILLPLLYVFVAVGFFLAGQFHQFFRDVETVNTMVPPPRACVAYAGETVGYLPSTFKVDGCSPELLAEEMRAWQHIDAQHGFTILELCKSIVGTVISWDGKHLFIDVEDKSVLNTYNITMQNGYLITEMICARSEEFMEKHEKEACGSYRTTLEIPRTGDKVKITGTFVTDTYWNEIHPITKIEVLE